MNASHYPSLELCKNLTEAGFPDTQYWYVNFDIDSWYPYGRDDHEEDFYLKSEFHISGRKYDKGRKDDVWISDLTKRKDQIKEDDSIRYVCPSIMELLDSIPNKIKSSKLQWHYLSMLNSFDWGIVVCYWTLIKVRKDTLPNALAEMWIWLKENKYLS